MDRCVQTSKLGHVKRSVYPSGEKKVSPQVLLQNLPKVLLSVELEKSAPPLGESWLPNSCYFRPKALLLSTPTAHEVDSLILYPLSMVDFVYLSEAQAN